MFLQPARTFRCAVATGKMEEKTEGEMHPGGETQVIQWGILILFCIVEIRVPSKDGCGSKSKGVERSLSVELGIT